MGFNHTPPPAVVQQGGAFDPNVYDALTIADLRARDSSGNVADNIYRIKSYAAKGTAGRREVQWIADSLEDDDEVSVIRPDDVLEANPGRYHHVGPLTARHAGFSIRNTLAENDIAFARLCQADGEFDFEHRKYAVSAHQSLREDLKARWSNGTLDFSATPTGGPCIDAVGPATIALGSLQADALQGQTALQIPAGNELLVDDGDVILVHSDRPWDASTALASEFKNLKSTAAGVLNIESKLLDEYLTGVHNPRVTAVKTELEFMAVDFTFIGDYGKEQTCFRFLRQKRAAFVRCNFHDFRTRAVNAEFGIELFGRDCYFSRGDQDGFGYGWTLGALFICDVDRSSGFRMRHLLTGGDGPGFGDGTPRYVLLRGPRFGDLHCLDALGSIRDSHSGVDKSVTGKVTGNKAADATLESAITVQGTREIISEINIDGMEKTGFLLQSLGCGDKGATNWYKFGKTVLNDDGDQADSIMGLFENLDTLNHQPIDLIEFESVSGTCATGPVVKPLEGDIRRFVIKSGNIHARVDDGIRAIFYADYKTEEIDTGECNIWGERYGIWIDALPHYNAQRSVAGALEWPCAVNVNGNIHGETEEAIRNEDSFLNLGAQANLTTGLPADNLVRVDATTGSTHRVGVVRSNGIAAMEQSDDVTANEIYALRDSIVLVPGGTTINKINLVDSRGQIITGKTEYLSGTVKVKRKPGTAGNVVISHDGAPAAGEIETSTGADIAIGNDQDTVDCILGAFSESFTAWSEGVV